MTSYPLQEQIADQIADVLDAENVLVLAEEQAEDSAKWVERCKVVLKQEKERLGKLQAEQNRKNGLPANFDPDEQRDNEQNL